MSVTYDLDLALSEYVAGVFTVDGSALDGTDGLSDVGLFDGTYDTITSDAQEPYQIVAGTDNLMAQVQAANMTVTVSRVDNPGYWNPNNPASPLNSVTPGFTPMRPGRLRGTLDDGTEYGIFKGFLRRATWNSQTRSCELYFEDILLWAARVYPTIPSTGPIFLGDAIKLLFSYVDAFTTVTAEDGILLDDFSADGTRSVTSILADLLAADLGVVFVNGDGEVVYERADTPLLRAPAATVQIATEASEEQSGIDLDAIGTRATVEKLDAGGTVVATATSINGPAETEYGRADIGAVSSAYVPTNGTGSLAEELTIRGGEGKPPVEFTIGEITDATDNTILRLILGQQLQAVYTILDTLGGTSGDAIVQRATHTIQTGFHQVQYLAKRRTPVSVFTVDGSALDGTDQLRYP